MMRRKIQTIGWFTALLTLTLLWVSPAMAANYDLYIAGTQVTDANCNNLSGIEGVTVAPGGEFKYDPAEKTLTMKDVTVSVYNYKNAIQNNGIEGLKIVISGSNRLEATKWSPLNCFASTKLEGNGSLTTTSKENSSVNINSTTLTVSDITLEATGKWGIAGKGGSKETLTLKNATVSAKGTEAAIADLKTVTLKECRIVAPEGAEWKAEKKAVVDKEGNKAKEVKIAPIEKYELYIAGTQVTDANCNNLKDITGVTVASDGEFKYNPAKNMLTMKGVTVSVGDGENAIWNKIEGLEIVISGSNRLEATTRTALFCFVSTEIEGYGSLTIASDGAAVFVGRTTLTISNITLEATGQWGIAGNKGDKETLTLKNATVNAKGTAAAIADLKTVTLEGCGIIAPEGGKFNEEKHAVVDAEGNKAKEVKIEPKYDLYIAGTQVTSLNCNALKDIKGVTVAPDGEFKYDPATTTLTMKDVTVQVGNAKNAIYNKGIEGLKIVVSGKNSLEATDYPSLAMQVSTFIEGSGDLKIISASTGILIAKNTLTISDITLEASGESGIAGWDGTKEKLILKNAKVTAKGSAKGISGFASSTTEGCEIVEPAGGKFDETKHAVVDAEGNVAKEVKIERSIPVTGVTVTPKTVDLTVGKTKQLSISVEPATATNKTYTCTSDNEGVATVTNTGLITAVSVGTATITITTEDGNKTETCKVTVTQSTSPDNPNTVEEALFANISVAPNPFSSQLRISHKEAINARYTLLDARGVILYQGSLEGTETTLNTENLKAGIYLLRLSADNSTTKTITVIKDR